MSPALAIRFDGQPVMSVPSRLTRPASARSAPPMIATAVLLPAPLGPISAHTCPAATAKLAPRRACTPPKPRCRSVQVSAAGSAASDVVAGSLTGHLRADRRHWPGGPGCRAAREQFAEAGLPLRDDALRAEPESDDEQDADDHV